MVIPAAVPPIDSAAASPRRREDSTPASAQTAELALKAFMSMNRAVAIIDADGRLLQPNLVFERLFGGSDLLDRINGEAIANDGKSDREITLNDGRAFWVETIPMDGGWLVSAYEMAERSAKAGTDTLTKLGNRLMFHTQLAALLASPDRAAAGTAVLELDLGRFKAIRESLGREVSGELLVSVAERIRSALAGGDVVARLGGDKFGIIQAGQAQPQAAAALAERLIDLIGRSHLIEGHLIDIEASVGIVLLPTDAADCEQLLKNADLALHRAKCDGPGSFRFFEPAMDAQMQRRRQFESDLRRAMALSEFSLVYQPQINLQRATVTGFEALLRWQSPGRGAAGRVHPDRGRYRHHRHDRRMGGADRLPGGGDLAEPVHGLGQCVGDPVPDAEPGRGHRIRAGGVWTRAAPPRTGDHGKRHARCRRRGVGDADHAPRTRGTRRAR